MFCCQSTRKNIDVCIRTRTYYTDEQTLKFYSRPTSGHWGGGVGRVIGLDKSVSSPSTIDRSSARARFDKCAVRRIISVTSVPRFGFENRNSPCRVANHATHRYETKREGTVDTVCRTKRNSKSKYIRCRRATCKCIGNNVPRTQIAGVVDF